MKFLLLKLLLLALAIYYIPKFCEDKTDGFTLLKIQSNLDYNSEWDVESPLLPSVFNQKFTYLASGGQAYAFVSADGKYVLKFFKHHLRRVPFFFRILPLPESWADKRKQQLWKREKKLLRDFRSYKLCMSQLPKETGLLYVHLNKTKHLGKVARIVDKLGIEHKVSLDSVEFILQKKATLALSYLDSLIDQNDMASAQKAVDSIIELITTRCKKGIYDEDAKIHRNFGFLGNQAMLIDVGRLRPDPSRTNPKFIRQELKKITEPLQKYLQIHCPDLALHLQDSVDRASHD